MKEYRHHVVFIDPIEFWVCRNDCDFRGVVPIAQPTKLAVTTTVAVSIARPNTDFLITSNWFKNPQKAEEIPLHVFRKFRKQERYANAV